MQRLVEDLRGAVPAAFETDAYRNRRKQIEEEFGERQTRILNEIAARARARGIALVRAPEGFGFGPLAGDGVMPPEEFAKLPASEQARLQSDIGELQEELEEALGDIPKWRREVLRKLRALHRDVTQAAVRGLIEEGEPMMLFGVPVPQADAAEMVFRRYMVNVLIEHSPTTGAPIVREDKPSHDALLGRIEHIAQMGTLVTDFSLIRAGALHRANGGYLILDAMKVLAEPYAWEALKRALRSREIRIRSLGQELSLIATQSLDPEPIPLDIKVVLVGPRLVYYLRTSPSSSRSPRISTRIRRATRAAICSSPGWSRRSRARSAAGQAAIRAEDVLRGSHLIDTSGARTGQVNGLAVTRLGSFSFGAAQRITARTRLGGRGIVDIERESELGGPIHSKGVMILSGYLAGRYATGKPLSLAATLVFEQSYGGVEGDSASSAELYALLSSLAEAPVAQSLAVTGSVNQHGDVQAIGGVNEKIEGFFELCEARGLTGAQGVLIPEANVKNLMLREEVVAAVRNGKFHVYPVRTVDEGIALLTGLPAAEVHARVEARLSGYAEQARRFAAEDMANVAGPAPNRLR